MPYTIFERKTPRIGSPVLSFSKIGQITFNQAASRILQKEPIEFVLLMWDEVERKLAIKAISNKKDPRAYKIHYNDKGNGASFSCKTFLDFIGVDYSSRKAIPIEVNPNSEIPVEVKVPDSLLVKKPHLIDKAG